MVACFCSFAAVGWLEFLGIRVWDLSLLSKGFLNRKSKYHLAEFGRNITWINPLIWGQLFSFLSEACVQSAHL